MPTSGRARASGLVLALCLSSLLVLPAPASAAQASIGAISMVPSDLDGDGLVDLITLNVTVDVAVAGEFEVDALAYSMQNGFDHRTLAVGTTVLHPTIRGFGFFNTMTDGPYLVEILLITYDPWNMTSAWVSTPPWRYTDFDPPGARFDSVGTPVWVDVDGNGRFEDLRIPYTLLVSDPGTYEIFGFLTNRTFSDGFYAYDDGTFAPGRFSRNLTIDASLIPLYDLEGPLRLYFYVRQYWGSSSDLVSRDEFGIPAVPFDRLNPLWASLDANVTDEGLDTDGDGLFEAVVVHLPLHLGRPGSVALTATLQGTGIQILSSLPSRALPAGDRTLDVVFPAYQLRSSIWGGPYLVLVNLQVADLLGYPIQASYLTAAYSPADFAPPTASARSGAATVVDADRDGIGEAVQVNLTADVANEGDYLAAIWTVNGTEILRDGRYVHLAAGTQTVSVRMSGITLSRAAPGPFPYFAGVLERLDSLPGDVTYWDIIPSSSITPANFAPRDGVTLRGRVAHAATGAGAPAIVRAYRAEDGFWTWVQSDNDGRYSLPLYNGTFTVLAEDLEARDDSVGVQVAVQGDTVRDFALPGVPWGPLSFDVGMEDWRNATVHSSVTWTGANRTARAMADYLGNFDGVADPSELGWWARYPMFSPYLSRDWTEPGDRCGVFVDGKELVSNATRTLTGVRGDGPVLLDTPVLASFTSRLQGPTVADAPDHVVNVALPYDAPGKAYNLTLRLPWTVLLSEGTASENVALSYADTNTWSMKPQTSPSPWPLGALASVHAWTRDVVPPTALLSGPDVAERGVSVTYDGSASTDRFGIASLAWNVTVNGTAVTGSGATFQVRFSEIGTFVVTLTARDPSGNAGRVSRAIVVRDTTPPPAPTSLQAENAPDAHGIHLSWAGVIADDLIGYRIYRSSDNGSTFAFLIGVASGTTEFTDTFVTAGSTYVYRVAAVDRYGNEGAPTLGASGTLTLPTENPSPAGLDTTLLLGASGAVAAAVVGVAFLLRRRRKA